MCAGYPERFTAKGGGIIWPRVVVHVIKTQGGTTTDPDVQTRQEIHINARGLLLLNR